MPIFDADPEVTGAQKEGDSFNGSPIVVGGKDDSGNVKVAEVDASGRIKVIQSAVVPPVGADQFGLSVPQLSLNYSGASDTNSPIIANDESLYLQLCIAGSELDGFGNRVDLIWVEGVVPVEHLIEQFIVHGPSVDYLLNDINKAQDGTELIGNGLNRYLKIRRTRFSGGSVQCPVSVRGYTQ